MAKRVKKTDTGEPEAVEMQAGAQSGGQSPLMATLMAANRKKFGQESVIVASEAQIFGVEPRSLALQWLFDLEVVPLQSLILFSGEAKSYKTTGMLELMRTLLSSDPETAGVIMNTEGKWSPNRCRTVLGDRTDSVQLVPITNNEGWQNTATHTLKTLVQIRAQAEIQPSKELPFGVLKPIAIGLDSLTGAQSERIQDEVIEKGHGSKTYQDRASSNWMWFNTWRPNLVGIPIALIVTQHLKDAIGTMVPMKVTAGGTAAGFMCDLEIRCKRIKEIDTTKHSGAIVRWKVHHNSLGADRRELDISIYEGFDAKDQPTTAFDWDQALVELIMKLQTEDKRLGKRVEAVLGGPIQEGTKGGVGSVYTCQALGIDMEKARAENITASVLGCKLQAYDSPLRQPLKEALRIPKATVLWRAPE